MRLPARWRWTAALGALALGLGGTAYLNNPRSSGLEGDWAAKAVDGTVVAGRALVGGGNTAMDLRTGKTITLGSVQGGTPFIGDERLVIATGNRVDSVRLDASSRWTWRAPPGATATPLAAGGGSTAVLVCESRKPCTLNGIGSQGRVEWTLATALDTTLSAPPALPRVLATPSGQDGIELTDPVTGRQTVRPGSRTLTTPDGLVVVPTEHQGACVVTAYRDADPAWVRVLGPCPGQALPTLASDGAWIRASWPGTVTTLSGQDGRTVTTRPARATGVPVATSQGVAATRTSQTVRTNPFRWGQHVSVLEVRDAAAGDQLAQLVTPEELTLLLLSPEAVVVREGDKVIRYTLEPGLRPVRGTAD